MPFNFTLPSWLPKFNFASKTPEPFIIPEWPNDSPRWSNNDLDVLLENPKIEEPQNITLQKIQENSENFPIKFPIETVRCKTLIDTVPKETLESYVNSVYPVLHENALALCCSFLNHKRKYGNPPEQELYANMTVLQLVQRLISKKAVLFVGSLDRYILLDGTNGYGNWEVIGTSSETDELNIRNCLSYDEIKLSAFLSISSYTNFINDGNRNNRGVTNRSNVESEGVIIGLIGTRLVKEGAMDYEEVIITQNQNSKNNGYGNELTSSLHSLFADFYGETCFTYSQALSKKKIEPSRFHEMCVANMDILFDNILYCKRIAISIDTLLIEANHRAKEKHTTAFVHVVGIGLGAWRCSTHQFQLFLDTFAKRIEVLGSNIHSISDIVFAYFDENAVIGGYKNGDTIPIRGHPKNGIKISISKRQPHVKLSGEDEGKLLVVSYAGDANSLPGNDFWGGSLHTSGDPAAASSTQVAELHNPHINPKVCGENLRIATPSGIVSFEQYREKFQSLINTQGKACKEKSTN